MKRELKINYFELEQIQEQVASFRLALEDMEGAAQRFEKILTEQESEAITELLDRHQEWKADAKYFHDNLEALEKLLDNYINDMTAAVVPLKWNEVMLVDRNDIWINLIEIDWNVQDAGYVAVGSDLVYYRDISTFVALPVITSDMTPEEVSAAWTDYHQKMKEKRNREENYNSLDRFCSGNAAKAKDLLDEYYSRLEAIYKNNIVVYENTDDEYKSRAGEVYDACTSFGERVKDNIFKNAKDLKDIIEGISTAIADIVVGAVSLVFIVIKLGVIEMVMQPSIQIMDMEGITPEWVIETRAEAEALKQGFGEAIMHPLRTLAAIGQHTSDMVEERGIPYAASYIITDVVIAVKGKEILKSLFSKAGEILQVGGVADDVLEGIEAIEGGSGTPKTIPQQLTREGKTPVIGKMRDLNTSGNVVDGEFKIADYLPDMGNPKANWHQNSGILRSVMNEGVPIKDVSMFPMDNAGFLGAERNLLQSRGWTYFEGYWYPPK